MVTQLVLVPPLVLTLFAMLLGHATVPRPVAGSGATLTNDQRDVLRTLRDITRAQWGKDVAAFEALTAEEFFELDGSGTMTTKVDWQRILRDEPPRIAVEPEAASAPIALNPGDTVRVVGTTAVAVTQRQGATTGQHVRTVSVLVKGAGRWRLLFATSQVTD